MRRHKRLRRTYPLRRQALGWLYARYWLPSMDYEQHSAASANGDSTTLATQEDFPALIMEQMVYYKDTSKKGLRDVSTAKPKELRRVCACIERLAESATNASSAGNSSSEAVRVYDWVVDALLVPGSLVPKSKKCVRQRRTEPAQRGASFVFPVTQSVFNQQKASWCAQQAPVSRRRRHLVAASGLLCGSNARVRPCAPQEAD